MLYGPINRAGLQALFAYNAYANRLILDLAAPLRSDVLTQVTSPSHASVHVLLTHMLMVEASYLAFCQNQPFPSWELSTLEAIRMRWLAVADDTQNVLATLSDADMAEERTVTLAAETFRFPLWQLFTQMLTHSAHHRGELSIVLTALGHPLPTLDSIKYFAEQSGQAWPWA